MRLLSGFILAVCCASLSLFSCLHAQSAAAVAVQPFSGEPFSVSAAELRSASAAVPMAKEFGAQILFEEGVYKISAAGTLIWRHRLIYRVDTDETAKGWAEIASDWDPWYEKPSQLHARVLEANGTFVELDQKTVTDAPVKAEDSETFSSEHERRAPLPGMAVGAIVEETETVEEKTPYFPGGSLYRFNFRQSVPAARVRLEVELPEGVPYKDAVHGLPGIAVTRSEKDGVRRVVYEATGMEASHEADVDLTTNEPVSPMVEFATGSSWGSIAKTYAGMAEPQTVTADAVPILPKNLPNARIAKIRAIVKQLHHEVRYTGVEFGAARLTPMRPSEVIQRHYGDCKDKATLLVAMLRAAGIKADLALLSTGPGRDVEDTLPGINRFDHAIVYVPADGLGTSPGTAAVWIDATAEYFAVGYLPYDDEGRNALIIAQETTGLTRTPAPKPEESVLVETRTFKLAEYGPSHVEETSETEGAVDATYRADYGGPETPKIHTDLENYVKTAYLAKKLTKVDHGEAADFDRPFKLTLVADGAKRGFSSLADAAVALYPATTLNSLPSWFKTEPAAEGPDMSADAKHELELARKSRPRSFTLRPYIYEMRARIVIPAGFEARALPANKTTEIGLGSLSETYSLAEPGIVEATFRYNSGRSDLTLDQALAMRTAVLAFEKRDSVQIFFDQAGAKALTAGHIREALEIDRKLIAADPSDAMHHLQFERVLLDAGIGDEAHAEARKATELDPKSAIAFETLGWSLEHDSLGEQFGTGFDLAGAIAAFKRAVALDPEDNDPRFDLAVLYEFDARGTRYADDADLPAAIRTYKELIELNKAKGDEAVSQDRDNLLYALLYSKQFAEMDKLLATLPANDIHRVLAITSATAQHGATAGIAQADSGNGSSDRNKNLRAAGTELANLHLYSEAAEVMSSGMQGGAEAAQAARQIELYKGLKPVSLASLPASDPVSPVRIGFMGLMAGTLTHEQAVAMTSAHAYSSKAAMEMDIQRALDSVGFMRRLAEKSGMTESVMLDLIAGNTTFSAKGDDEHGWSVLAQVPGGEPDRSYVVKEDGAYKVVAGDKSNTSDNTAMGNEILWSLEHGRVEQARAMLDWKRDATHKAGGDDPFEGPLLPRFWTIGSSKPGADSHEAMRIAGIALLARSMDAKPYLAEIAAERERETGQRQTDLDLLLAETAIGAEQPAIGMPAAKRLLEQEPDSTVALNLMGQGFSLENDPAGWQALLAPRLAKKPDDHDLLAERVRAYELAHDWKSAKVTAQKVLDSGKATAADYNDYAWMGLFDNDLGDDITKAAQQGAQMNKNAAFAELHTLACIDAAQGKTTEARQVLQQAMDAGNMVQPNSAVWYALGMIYEQYGAKSAALDAYRKVQAHERDDHTYIAPTSTYVLARARIAAIAW